jgi:hypothetical protein
MPQFSPAQQASVETLARDLERAFGGRLQSIVAYWGHHGDGSIHSTVIIEALAFEDLATCLPLVEVWHRRGVAVPLMLSSDELARTLDIFPLEYASIIADHLVVRGSDPFATIVIPTEDARRACEAQAKSHLIHLREAFLESHGETRSVAQLIAASASSLRALLANIARLPDDAGHRLAGGPALSDDSLARMAETRMHVSAALVREVLAASAAGPSTIGDPSAILSRYVEASQRIWNYVDRWR